jgi:alkaline phosphatase D
MPARLRLGVGSCQHYAHGWFGAYRHVAADALDLFLHVGDYIYESSWGDDLVRSQGAQEPVTLDDYRRFYALYRTDPDLQAAHASCPWLVVWDDHEVDNDYSDAVSQDNDEPAWFLARRAAAYQAYYEHMPLPRTMVPFGPHMRLHTQLRFGQLAELHMLDDRQYRSQQPCPRPGRAGSAFISDCTERLDPSATMLGTRQEQWLAANLRASTARWNLLGQQTLMAQADGLPGPGERFYSDGWDGYPAARRRLLDVLAEPEVRNPVVLGGDVHSFWVADLKPDFDDPASPTIASEFVGTSITSQSMPEERIQAIVKENPHIRYAGGRQRGYLRVEVTPEQLRADLRGVCSVKVRDPSCETQASFIVEDGRPGAQPA